MQEIDQRDRELLGALQGEIPLVSTPFALIGQKIEMSEKEVIKRTEKLRRDGLVRQIALQFDSRALGYRSCLVAAKVTPDREDEAAGVISAHPGVTQNYRRNHDFNLWFTLAVAPESALGLEKTIELLSAEAGCEAVRALPTLRLFKTSSADGVESYHEEPSSEYTPLSRSEVEAVRLLQRDLPLQPRPFDVLARNTTVTPDDLLAAARTMQARGQIRRVAALVQPRKTGFTATAMGVWSVPAERIDEVGARLAQNRAVSHCYLRPTHQDWPYNVYTTVHARSVDECESIINDLAADTGLEQRRALFPTREYKKSRIHYYAPEAEEWEQSRASSRAAAAS